MSKSKKEQVAGAELSSKMSEEQQNKARSIREQIKSSEQLAEINTPKSKWSPEVIEKASEIFKRGIEECRARDKMMPEVKSLFSLAKTRYGYSDRPIKCFINVCMEEEVLPGDEDAQYVHFSRHVIMACESLMMACCKVVYNAEKHQEREANKRKTEPAKVKDIPGDIEDQESRDAPYDGTDNSEYMDLQVSFIDVAEMALHLIHLKLNQALWDTHKSSTDTIYKESIPWTYKKEGEFGDLVYGYSYSEYKVNFEDYLRELRTQEEREREEAYDSLPDAEKQRRKQMAAQRKAEAEGLNEVDI